MFPTSELKTSGPSLEGCRRCSLPSTAQANLGEAGREAPGEETPRKKKCSDLRQNFFAGGQGCGEVCREDGRWIRASPSERRGPE